MIDLIRVKKSNKLEDFIRETEREKDKNLRDLRNQEYFEFISNMYDYRMKVSIAVVISSILILSVTLILRFYVNLIPLMFSVLGSLFLVKSYFKTKENIALESSTYYGYNVPLAESMVNTHFNSVVGAFLMAISFAAQAISML
ncbi:MAG: hypothetical protein V1911_01540 [Candidatus Micrarchaeota archaeon]